MARRWLGYDEVRDIAGEDAARAVCRVYGGMSMYLPANAAPEHPLSVLMGFDAFRRLCVRAGGVEVVFSKRRGSRKHAIITRLEEGRSCSAIARELDVTARYVQLIASGMRQTGSAGG